MNPPAAAFDRPAGPRIAADAGLALVLGVAAYALSCWIVPPGDVAKGFGEQWQLMSQAPFELRGMFPHRMLAPLLAWCCGQGGDGYLTFVRGLGVLLLATVAFYGRRRGLSAADAALVTAAIALTAPIQLYKDHWVGYPDPLCYSLLLGNLLAKHRPGLFWSLWLVNLTNHELAVFLLPWLWFVRRSAGGPVLRDAIGAGLVLALYAGFYLLVKAKAAQLFTYEYFASHPLFPGGSIVVLALAMVHLVCTYGPVLAVIAWHQHNRAFGKERLHFWLVGAAIVVIFCIAFDWARHSNLILIPLVLASVRFLQQGHRLPYAGLVGAGALLMLWIPPWSPNAWPTDAMANIFLLTESGVALIQPPRFPGDFNVLFGPPSAALQNWLPRVAPMLGCIAAIGAAIWAAGFAYARLRPAREDAAASVGEAASTQ